MDLLILISLRDSHRGNSRPPDSKLDFVGLKFKSGVCVLLLRGSKEKSGSIYFRNVFVVSKISASCALRFSQIFNWVALLLVDFVFTCV